MLQLRAMSLDNALRDGEPVILIDRKGRRYLKHLRAGHRIVIRGTVVKSDSVIGTEEGSMVGRGQPEAFRVFRPSYAELIPLIARTAEPIFPKDVGMILTRGDIRPGQTVLEIGVGAGATSMALLRAVGESGRLISQELRPEMAEGARKTVHEHFGPAPNWEIRIGDGREALTQPDRGADQTFDRVVADVPDPEALVESVAEVLRSGGIFVSYVPSVTQVIAFHGALDAHPKFGKGDTFEALERSWHVEGLSVRPDQRMVAHTGFLTFVRRLGG